MTAHSFFRIDTLLVFLRLFAIFCVAVPCLGSAATVTGRVVSVTDGDTMVILDSDQGLHKVRLQGIDAPEKSQPFGRRSKDHLSDLAFSRSVLVEYSKKDRYGRLVGRVMVQGVDVNLQQIRAGMAWHYKEYEKEQPVSERIEYSNAERLARQNGRGLWIEPTPMPPWEFRRKKR